MVYEFTIVVYLCGDLLGGELFANRRAVELDVTIIVPDDAVGDLLGLLVDLVHLAADEAFDGEEGVLRVDDGLALGDLADEAVPGLGVGDDRGRGPCALSVRDDRGLAALHGGDGRIGGPEVDPHHLLAGDPQWAPPPAPATAPVHRRGGSEVCGGAAAAVGGEEGGRGGEGRGRHV